MSTSESELFKKLQESPCSVLSPDPQEGPDGFPYLFVSTDAQGNSANQDQFRNIANWCASRGIGVVINPSKDGAEYLFTYGMLWNYILRGEFLTPAPPRNGGALNIEPGQILHAGMPSEDYWPSAVKKIFKEFLLQQGIMDLRSVQLMETPGGPVDLCFSLESLGHPPETEWSGILEAFSWFFPRHYSLSLISEKNFKTEFMRL